MGNIILINADDFGFNSSVNKAIIESFKKGLITTATIMANMPGFEEAVELTHNYKLDKKIGVHLVLTDGLSLTEEIKSIDIFFNSSGIPTPLRFKRLFFLNRKYRNIIFNEYSAQIEKVRNSGIPITHLDTHHQIHDMWSISQIVIELLKTYKIPSMRILRNLGKSNYSYKRTYRNIINQYLKVQKVNFSDFLGDQLDFVSILKKDPLFLRNERNTRIEIMVHPDLNYNGLVYDRIEGKEYELNFQKVLTEYYEPK